ncbi:UNVERIFIED_CONTAM: hypothetical protein HDU68_007879 [Siphonaria sp. JEL0065]|nr:hypothetical protein HDU68_007879 [Siphonaria sp. JEL0065]
MSSLQHSSSQLAKRYIVYGYGYDGYGMWSGLVITIILIALIIYCWRKKQATVEVPVQQAVYTTTESLPMYTATPVPYAVYSPSGSVPPQQQQIFIPATDAGNNRLGVYSPPAFDSPNYYHPVQSEVTSQADHQPPTMPPPSSVPAATSPPVGQQPPNRVPTADNYYKY